MNGELDVLNRLKEYLIDARPKQPPFLQVCTDVFMDLPPSEQAVLDGVVTALESYCGSIQGAWELTCRLALDLAKRPEKSHESTVTPDV